jgi:hypothetical protein
LLARLSGAQRDEVGAASRRQLYEEKRLRRVAPLRPPVFDARAR